MKPSQSSTLFLRCPIIYRGRYDGPTKNLMCFGFECGPGWFSLIYDLSVEIETIAEEMKNKSIPESDLPLVSQVKEKYGSLRFYLHNMTREIDELIEVTCEKSEVTCETCGSEGTLFNNNGWFHTLCVDCQKQK